MRRWGLALALVGASDALANEVTAGAPIVLGPRAVEALNPVLTAAIPAIAGCAETAGDVVAKFTIAPNGTVTAASIKASTLTVPEVDRCVLSVVLKLAFPKDKSSQSTVVSIPFRFAGDLPPPAASPTAPPAAAEGSAKVLVTAAPPSGPASRAAGTLVVGTVRPAEVEAAVDAELSAVGACINRLRPAVSGSAVLRFGFDPAGLAQQIVVIDGTADATAAAPCFATHLGELRIGPGEGLRAAYVRLELSP